MGMVGMFDHGVLTHGMANQAMIITNGEDSRILLHKLCGEESVHSSNSSALLVHTLAFHSPLS